MIQAECSFKCGITYHYRGRISKVRVNLENRIKTEGIIDAEKIIGKVSLDEILINKTNQLTTLRSIKSNDCVPSIRGRTH